MTATLAEVYDRLLEALGPQHWWPGQSPFEVMVGAVLVQNTNWKNVEKAIAGLRRADLLHYLDVMADRPHRVRKEINGQWREAEEFFVTDLVEFMAADGLSVGHRLVADENEVMGIDDDAALQRAQALFATSRP